jgi:serine/threonine-protein kinase RsbW
VETATAALRYTGVFHGTADQVRQVRRDMARRLAGCPAANDAVLIVSELAANAVLHSTSAGQFFTVRAELHGSYLWLEVEDCGGPRYPRPHDGARPHGLDVVAALTGPDGWGVDGDASGRVVWARLKL